MMNLRINPLDPVFFRDGKPFSLGEEVWADGSMLPNPSVLYGALRTAIAVELGIPFSEVQTVLSKENFSVRNIHYFADGRDLFPLPFDLVWHEGENDEKKREPKRFERWETNLLELLENKSILSKNKAPFSAFMLHPKDFEQAENLENGVCQFSEIKNYLEGGRNEFDAFKLSDYIKSEPKVGNGRNDDTHTVLEGSLYRVDMFQYAFEKGAFIKNVEIRCQIELKHENGQPQKLQTLVKLGGDAKLAEISVNTKPSATEKPTIEFTSKRFKVYLSTPAIFTTNSWYPDLSKFGVVNAKLLTASVGKTISIGGWDMVKRAPKTMYRAVPAGSVYYFEAETDVSNILNASQGISISDEMPEQGFGIAYFGNV